MTRTTKRSARRAGFTMVEMLVVVTIIAILISLTAAAVLKLIPAQQAFNTQTELTRLQGDLVRSYRSAADKFRKEPVPTSGPLAAAYSSVLTMAGNDPNLARVIWVKLRLKQTFPNNFSEALNPAPFVPGTPIALSYYKTKLAALGYTSANTYPNNGAYGTQLWESSVCLLLALQRGEDSQALQESDIGTSSLKDFTSTINGQTIKGVVDNWGTPLAFCRWPVYSTQLNPTGPQLGDNNDSDDPSGLLESSNWQMNYPAGFSQFQNYFHPLVAHPATNPPTEAHTYRIYPLIVSGGPPGDIISLLGIQDKGRLGLDQEPLGPAPGYVPQPQQGLYNFAVLPGAQGAFAANNIYPQLASPK